MLWLAPYCAYNVFRRKRQPVLCCAVRQDRPVPGFIQGETWAFGGTVLSEEPPDGFEAGAAHQATQQTGYYLFHALQA